MTRKEYMNGNHGDRETANKLFRAYYGQFVTPEVLGAVHQFMGAKLLTMSKDEDGAFNDIALRRWDAIPMPYGVSKLLEAQGDYLTAAGKVCIMKEAARQIRETALASEVR